MRGELRHRLARLQQLLSKESELRFAGLLEYDPATESEAAGLARATAPGIYLLTSVYDTTEPALVAIDYRGGRLQVIQRDGQASATQAFASHPDGRTNVGAGGGHCDGVPPKGPPWQ